MGFFDFGKKKETQSSGCSCQCSCSAPAAQENTNAAVLILGSGCRNCQTLEANARTALEQMGKWTVQIGHVTDFSQIAQYGVMSTPALVVKGKVLSYGKVLSPEEITKLLEKENL